MFSIELIRDLYRHMDWADATVWNAVEACDAALSDEYIHHTLHHIHATQHAFLSYWLARDVSHSRPSEFQDLSQIRSWSLPVYTDAVDFLDRLRDEDLARQAEVPWARYFARLMGREAAPTTLGETLFQVAMHSAYHRGQVNRRLRELGGEPPLVDYIAWLWAGRSTTPRTLPQGS